MMPRSRSKSAPGESIIPISRRVSRDYTARVFAYARLTCMASADSDEGFRVTDRRRRADDDDILAPTPKIAEPAPVAAPRVEIPGNDPARPAPRAAPAPDPMASGGEPERSLAG